MGSAKADLAFAGGVTFLERLLSEYAAIGCDVVVVRAASAPPFPLVSRRGATRPAVISVTFNPDASGDRLSSIRCGIAAAGTRLPLFVQDVDRPFASARVLHSLLAHMRAGGYAAPAIGGRGGHPLLLSAEAAALVLDDRRSTTLREALAGLERELVAVGDTACELNINTPEDYRAHFAREAPHVP
jgi:nicotine blue oxidoreductase